MCEPTRPLETDLLLPKEITELCPSLGILSLHHFKNVRNSEEFLLIQLFFGAKTDIYRGLQLKSITVSLKFVGTS